jgi:hypothetical protein
MADQTLLQDPVALAAIASLAAQDGRPDALARGNAAAQNLADKGLWTAEQLAQYQGRTDAERLKAWKAGIYLKDLAKPDDATIAAIKALYQELYAPPPPEGGFLDTWAILKSAAIMAALDGDPEAVKKGDVAAQALAQAAQWDTTTYGLYLALADDEKIAFWASGGDATKLVKGTQKPQDKPAPEAGSGGLIKVAGIVGGLWILSKLIGK